MKTSESFTLSLTLLLTFYYRVGLPDPYPTSEDRKRVFSAIDENGDESVSADEWLVFCAKEIIAKVK